MRLTLVRLEDHKDGVFGELRDIDRVICRTVEKRWHNNQNQISCIPRGVYQVTKRVSEKYGHHWHILDVPKRDLILFHNANWSHQLKGCVGVGLGLSYGTDNKTGINAKMVTQSVATMDMLRETLPDEWEVEIMGVVG